MNTTTQAFRSRGEADKASAMNKQYLRLKTKLNARSEQANRERFEAEQTGTPSGNAPRDPRTLQEKQADVVGQRIEAKQALFKIFGDSVAGQEEANQFLSTMTPDEVRLFNEWSADIADKLKTKKNMSAAFFRQYFNRYLQKLGETAATNLDIPLQSNEFRTAMVANIGVNAQARDFLGRIGPLVEQIRNISGTMIMGVPQAINNLTDNLDRIQQAIRAGNDQAFNLSEETSRQVGELYEDVMTMLADIRDKPNESPQANTRLNRILGELVKMNDRLEVQMRRADVAPRPPLSAVGDADVSSLELSDSLSFRDIPRDPARDAVPGQVYGMSPAVGDYMMHRYDAESQPPSQPSSTGTSEAAATGGVDPNFSSTRLLPRAAALLQQNLTPEREDLVDELLRYERTSEIPSSIRRNRPYPSPEAIRDPATPIQELRDARQIIRDFLRTNDPLPAFRTPGRRNPSEPLSAERIQESLQRPGLANLVGKTQRVPRRSSAMTTLPVFSPPGGGADPRTASTPSVGAVQPSPAGASADLQRAYDIVNGQFIGIWEEALTTGDYSPWVEDLLNNYTADYRQVVLNAMNTINTQSPNGMDRAMAAGFMTDYDQEILRRQRSGRGFSSRTNKHVNNRQTDFRFKVGRGLDVEQAPRFYTFGSKLIHTKSLRDGVLSPRYKSGVSIPRFPPTGISKDLQDYIMECIHDNKIHRKGFTQLSKDDQTIFRRLCKSAGVWTELGEHYEDPDKEMMDRFELLRGHILAGGDNHEVLDEFKQLVFKLIRLGKMTIEQAEEIISALP